MTNKETNKKKTIDPDTCCMKCKRYGTTPSRFPIWCSDNNCPCHQQPKKEEEPEQDECRVCGYAYFKKDGCNYCKPHPEKEEHSTNSHMPHDILEKQEKADIPHPEPIKSWEEEFDKICCQCVECKNNKPLWNGTTEELRNFIHKIILSERTALVEWAEKRCKDNIEVFGTDKWNSDLEDLISLLKKKCI